MTSILDSNLLSTKDASALSGYNSDYLSRLCRSGKIAGTQVGRTWLIERASLEQFVREQEDRKREIATELSQSREKEYQQAQKAPLLSAKTRAARGPVRSPYASFIRKPAVALIASFVIMATSAYGAVGPVASMVEHSGAIASGVVRTVTNSEAEPRMRVASSVGTAATANAIPRAYVQQARPLAPSADADAIASRIALADAPDVRAPQRDPTDPYVDAADAAASLQASRAHTERAFTRFMGSDVPFLTRAAHAYVALGSATRDTLYASLSLYEISLNHAGESMLAFAATTRDAVAFAPRASMAVLDTYANGIDSWVNTSDAIIAYTADTEMATGPAVLAFANGAQEGTHTFALAAQSAVDGQLNAVRNVTSLPARSFAYLGSQAQNPVHIVANAAAFSPFTPVTSGSFMDAGRTVALATYRTIHGWADSAQLAFARTLAFFRGGTRLAIVPLPPAVTIPGYDVRVSEGNAYDFSGVSYSTSTGARVTNYYLNVNGVTEETLNLRLQGQSDSLARLIRRSSGGSSGAATGIVDGSDINAGDLHVAGDATFDGTVTLASTLTSSGEISAPFFTATSLTATSTMPNLVVNSFGIGGEYVTDLTGSGLAIVNGVLTATASTSNSFQQGGNSFGATATIGTADTNALSFITDGIQRMVIDAAGNIGIGTGATASKLTVAGDVAGDTFTASGAGTSTLPRLASDAFALGSDYVTDLTGNGLAIVGGVLGLDAANNYFSTTSTDFWFTTKTTDTLAEGLTNLYFTNARADARINATSTIGTLTSAPNLGTVATTLSGILKATAGVLSPAVAGTDYENPLSFAYPLVRSLNAISLAFGTTTANSWSALQEFNGGASTTQLTSTGNAYLATAGGGVAIGTTSLAYSLNVDGDADITGVYRINGTQVLYLPDQSSFTGSYFSGNGGTNLSHSGSTEGFYNTGLGIQALDSLTKGNRNTAVGYQSLFSDTVGSYNTALGVQSLYSNVNGNYNTAMGREVLYYNVNGSNNVGVGYTALSANTSGSFNVGIGTAALFANQTGSQNVAIGYQAGRYISDGVSANTSAGSSVYIGYGASPLASGETNQIVIGNQAIGAGSDSVTIGSASTTKSIFNGNVGIGTTSPYAKLSVAGEVVGQNFTATSTTATSTLPLFATTKFALGSDYVTDLTGTGLTITAGALGIDASFAAYSTTSANYWLTTKTTDNLTQGSTNKYYADALARAAFSSTATGLTYTSGTGVFSLTSGYNIPLTASTTDWNTAYVNRITGTTYPIQFSSNVLSLAFGTTTANSWSALQQFNGGASTTALTVAGQANIASLAGATVSSLTANYLPKWNSGTFENSQFFDDGTNAFVGTTTNSGAKLTVAGTIGTQLEGDIFKQYDASTGTWYPVLARYWNTSATAFDGGTYLFGNGSNAYVGIEVPGGSDVNTFQVKATNSTFSGTSLTSGLATFSSGINVNGETFTDLTGSGLTNSSGVLTLDRTGDWTGTFDGQEGSYYQDLANATGVLAQANGGTGISSFTAGDIIYVDNTGTLTKLPVGGSGTVLKVQAGLPSWGTDQTVGGGGSDGIFATSSGKIYPLESSAVVLVGTNATTTANSIFEVNGQQYISTKLSIATTTAPTQLSVGGSGYFTGGLGIGVLNTSAGTLQTSSNGTIGGSLTVIGSLTSGDATTTSLYASTLGLGSDYFTDLTGSGLTNSSGVLTLDRTGDWTGTFDGQEGSYYLANSFSTTSAAYFLAQNTGAAYSTTSANYWLTTKSTTNLAEGSNLYFTNARADARINATSTIGTLTSAPNLGTVKTSLSGILKATAGVLSVASAGTDYENPLTFGYPLVRSTNAISLAFGTTTANSWSALQTFTSGINVNGETFTDLTGSGLTNSSGVLTLDRTGDWTGTFDGQEGSYYLNANNLTNFGTQFYNYFHATTTDALAEGSTNLYWTNTRFDTRLSATTTLPNITTLANLGTVKTSLSGLLKATSGVLSAATAGTDYLAPSSLTATYPVQYSANTFSLAFGTTTENSWGAPQHFNGGASTTQLTLGSDFFTDLTGSGLTNSSGVLTLDRTGDWTGTFDGQEGSYYLANSFSTTSAAYFLAQNTGAAYSTTSANYWLTTKTTDNLTQGSTNKYYADALARAAFSSTATGLTYTSGTGVFSLTSGYNIPLTASTTDWNAAYLNRITGTTYPIQFSSNVLSLAFGTTTANSWSALQQFNGGASTTQLTTTGNTYLASAGGRVGIGTTTPGSLLSLGGIANFTTATSTFYGTGGINLTAGCFAIGGVCVGSNSVTSATYPLQITGQNIALAFGTTTANSWSALQAFNGGISASDITTTGSITNGGQFIGLNNDGVSTPSFTWASDLATGIYHPGSNSIGFATNGIERGRFDSSGFFGIGTSTPSAALSVEGDALFHGTATIDGLGSGLVKATNGILSVASAGTDYQAPITATYPIQISSNNLSLAFGTTTANTWSSAQTFNGGITASQVIDSGLTANTLTYANGSKQLASVTLGTGLTLTTGTLSIDTGAAYSTTSANYWLTTKSTTDLAEGSNLYWTNTRFDTRLSATTSLPNITTLANLGTVKTSLSGILKATSGVLSAATAGTDYENPLTFGYPLVRSTNAISLAFGTTTANSWAGTQTFGNTVATNATATNSFSSRLMANTAAFGQTATSSFSSAGVLTLAGALNGPLQANNGVVSATTSIGALYGGTGSTTLSGILVGNGTSAVNTLTLPSFLSLSGSTLSLNGALGIANGGTGTTTQVTNGVNYYDGTKITSNGNFTFSGTTGQLSIPTNGWLATGGTLFAYASSTNQATVFGIGAGGQVATTSSAANGIVAIGFNALNANTSSGYANTAVGWSALSSSVSGGNNTALGYNALRYNVSGGNNTGIGDGALLDTSGNDNTSLGHYAGFGITSGSSNVAVGSFAGYGNGGGFAYAANRYTAVGYGSGRSLSTGGDDNTFFGYQAGRNVGTGYGNILIGPSIVSSNLTTGSGNIGLGYNTLFPSSGTNNFLNIGGLVFGTLPATTTAFTLPTSGALGIGSSSPYAKLSIHTNNGDTATTLFAIGSSTASATTTLFSISNTGIITSNASATSTFAAGLNITAGCFAINGTCVGGNTLSFSYPLQLSGTTVSLAFGTTTANSWSQLQAFDGGLTATTINTTGSITTGAQFIGLNTDGVSAPSFTWGSDLSTGIYHPGSNSIGFATNGIERGRFDSSGFFGLGSSTPSEMLSVEGNALINGKLTANNASTSLLTVSSSTYLATLGGRVGIGTTSPIASLQVQGSGIFTEAVGIGNFAVDVGVPTSSNLQIYQVVTDTTAFTGIKTNLILTPGGTPNDNSTAISGQLSTADASDYTATLAGVAGSVWLQGTGSVADAVGVSGDVLQQDGSVSSTTGVRASITVTGGSLTDAYGVSIAGPYNGGGTITNAYGLYIEDQGSALATDAYNIYSAGSTSKNYFAGSVGIGTTSPGSLLSVAGNTYTSGTATIGGPAGGTLTVGTGASGGTFNLADGSLTKNSGDYFVWSTGIRLNTSLGRSIVLGGSGLVGTDYSIKSDAGLNFYVNSTNSLLNLTSGGSVGIGTTTPGSLLSIGNTNGINFSTATSTFSSTGGINLTAGCFAVNGTCITASSGSGTVNSGTIGQFPYYAANGTALTATSSIFVATSGRIGIGTTTPASTLSVAGSAAVTGLFDLYNNAKLHNSSDASKYVTLQVDPFNTTDAILTLSTMHSGSPVANFQFGAESSVGGYSNIWPGGVTPTSSNFTLQANDSGTDTWLNATSVVYLDVSDSATPSISARYGHVGINYNYSATTAAALGVIGNDTTTGIGFQLLDSASKPLITELNYGSFGVGTTSPFAKVSIQANPNDNKVFTTLFAIGSSTASATTTLFSISNTGAITSNASATSTFAAGLNITSGCFAVNGTCLSSGASYTATYPVTLTGSAFGLAFGTTTANSWSSLQTFGSGFVSQASSTIASTLSLGDTLSLTKTGTSTITTSDSSGSGGPSLLITTGAGTAPGNITIQPTGSSGAGAQVFIAGASSAFGAGGNVVIDGGSGTSNGNILLNTAGGRVGIGTSTPGSLLSIQGIANFTTATSTFQSTGGINLTAGCFAVNGACISAGTPFSNTLAGGGTATTTFYAGGVVYSDGSKLTQAAGSGNKIFNWDNTNGRLGLGTSTPWAQLSINPNGITGPAFAIGSSTQTLFTIGANGQIGTDLSAGTSTLLTFAGRSFIVASTTGENTAVGLDSLSHVSAGTSNTALGYRSLANVTTGVGNIGIGGGDGSFAGNNNYSIAIGNLSGFNSDYGIALGYSAISDNIDSIAFGHSAYSDSNNSIAFGYSTYTSGATSTAIGSEAQAYGDSSVVLGDRASAYELGGISIGLLAYTENGDSGIAIGANAGAYGPYSTVIGGGSYGIGSFNTIVGANSFAGNFSTGGSENIILGSNSGSADLSGFGNILIGNNTYSTSTTASRFLNIGGLVFGTLPATSTAFTLPTSGSIGIGSSSPYAKFSIQTNAGDTAKTLFAIGSSTASATTTLFSISNIGQINLGFGSSTTTLARLNGRSFIQVDEAADGWNTGFGLEALESMTTSAYGNTAFGIGTLASLTTGSSNTAIGTNYSNSGISALYSLTSGDSNIAIGSALGTIDTGSNNVAIGDQAAVFWDNVDNTVSIGSLSGGGNTGGTYAKGFTTIGDHAGSQLTSGADYNTFLGYGAGKWVTTGFSNILIGALVTGSNLTTGSGNLGIGNNTFFPSATANNQLNIGGLVFGTLPATSTAFTLPTSGSIGIGSSSPYAKFSIQTNAGDTAKTLFAIGSSTASATTTLFSINNAGVVAIGTTSPTTQYGGLFASAGPIYIGGASTTATSTIEGNLLVIGTLKVGANSTYITEKGLYQTGVGSNSFDFNGPVGTALSISNTGFGTTTLSGLNINGSATSTSNVGFNLTGGCFAVNGVCITGGGSSFTNTIANGGTATTTFYDGGVVFSDGSKLTQATGSGDSIFSWDNTNGRLGLGISALDATARLQVEGNAIVNGPLAIGNFAALVGTHADDQTFSIFQQVDTPGGFKGMAVSLNLVPGADSEGVTSIDSEIITGDDSNYSELTGINSQVTTSGAGNVDNLTGVVSQVNIGGTGLASTVTAVNAFLSSDGQATNATSLYGGIYQDAGTITNASAILGSIFSYGGEITNAYGVKVTRPEVDTGVITNNYGLYIEDQSSIASGEEFNIYSAGAAAKNYFGGFTGIGSTSPYAKLSIHANNGDTATTLFAIGSSTASATTTLFSISNTGAITSNGSATSTFAAGLNITSGCFAINGTCVGGGGGGSGTVNSGTTGQFPYYAANGTALTATSSLFMAANGNVGVGTTTPSKALSVFGNTIISGGSFDVGTGSSTVNAINLGGTGANTITIGNTQTAGSIALGAAMTTGTISIGGTGLQTGTLTFGGGTGAQTVNLGTGNTGIKTVNLGTGTAANVISIGTGQTAGSISIGTAMTTGIIKIGNVASKIGIGSTTPWAQFSINPSGLTGPIFAIGSSTGTKLVVGNNGYVGIGTTTPGSLFSVQGIANFTAATSTFSSTGGINLTGGCFAVNGTCIGSGGGASLTGSTGQIAYFSGTNTAAGTSTISISTSGAVGIGKSSPVTALDVSGPNSGPPYYSVANFTSTSGDTNITISNPSATQVSFFGQRGGAQGYFTSPQGFGIDVYGGATSIAWFKNNGDVGLGGTTSSVSGGTPMVSVNGTSGDVVLNSGNLQIAALGAGTLQTDSSGNVSVSSDERLKDINGSFKRGLAEIRQLDPILYHWNAISKMDQSTQYAGFSAQDVQAAIPEAVDTDPRGYLTLADRPILAASVNAIKELASRTDLLSVSTTTLGSRIGGIESQLAADAAAQAAPKPLNATDINAQSLTITGNAFATKFIAPASPITFTISSTTGTIPNEILAEGGVDLYKAATYAITGVQSLTAKTELLAGRIDAVEMRVAMLEAIASSTPTTGGTLSLASLKDMLAQLGIVIQDGIAHFTSLAFTNLIAAPDANGTSAVATSTIAVGQTETTVANPFMHTTSKIFVTITSPLNGSWYIREKAEGSFTIALSSAQDEDVTFDYFIVQTEGQTQVASAAAAPTPTPVTSTPPADAGTGTPSASSTPTTNAPTITLNGEAAVDLAQGASWTDPGATATDAAGNDLTSQIAVTGSVDTETVGLYTLNYSVVDSTGLNAGVSRIVHVGAPTLPGGSGTTPTPAPTPTPEPTPTPTPTPAPAPDPAPIASADSSTGG